MATWTLRVEPERDGWQVRASGETLARYARVGAGRAVVTCAEGVLTLSHAGFVRPRVLLRRDGLLLAALVPDFSGHGHVELEDGDRLAFDRLSVAGGEVVLLDGARRRLLHVLRDGDGSGARVQADEALGLHRSVPLALLCWHVLLADLEDPRRPMSVSEGPRVEPRSRFQGI